MIYPHEYEARAFPRSVGPILPRLLRRVRAHAMNALHDADSRADLLNRLRRAEGQLRGIQRMIAEGDDCMRIAQQLSAVRKALDSAYVRMTVCFMEQELTASAGNPGSDPRDLTRLLGDVEALIGKIR